MIKEKVKEELHPILFENKENCSGCSACYSICPKKAISMVEDEEGFLYPEVDYTKCIHCNKCMEVCNFHKVNDSLLLVDTFAIKASDEERKRSQSGGLFAVISEVILEAGGVVYGCIFNEKFEAVHERADTKLGRDLMRHSKYVQSNKLDTFCQVLEDLKQGKKVLFTGTSCEVVGLISFIENKNLELSKNLYCVDLICHGVPSPLVWRDYLNWESKKTRGKIKNVVCRNKHFFGWHSHVTTIKFSNLRTVESMTFTELFGSDCILRPACYECPYKDIYHKSDITMGDCWGIEKNLPSMDDNKGVSLALVNSEKGSKLLELATNKLEIRQINIRDFLQEPLKKAITKPDNREVFWQDYKSKDFFFIAKKYGKYKALNDFKWKIKKYLKWNLKRY
ncbi:Coenzyme F420 hydrogenase/dehydrogenase, beta subunit C-terminal domain [Lachnospira multipara]|uniref:Coenzyme F420 hydrogenase/dehydrogenase, beta subunit C-terminal domain n=1 Tax=Lachnospira multipara TaxID=28051 RepID=UPI0003F84F5B|nr:Coenzyme F420 hydrogenase/dehydrogenase, beta subunit C-terminal domain [Lachnospira multipara]